MPSARRLKRVSALWARFLCSGFVWDRHGHIVTNYHVIRGASALRVALIDQSVYPARVLGGDPSKDVAVLQLEAPPEVLRELKPVRVGHSDGLFVGQNVTAIGNPFGLDHSMSNGIISGLNRELPTGARRAGRCALGLGAARPSAAPCLMAIHQPKPP